MAKQIDWENTEIFELHNCTVKAETFGAILIKTPDMHMQEWFPKNHIHPEDLKKIYEACDNLTVRTHHQDMIRVTYWIASKKGIN